MNMCFSLYRYRWIVYINPNYYAVSSVAVFVLSNFTTDCAGSELACSFQSGSQILRQFDFDQVNPYLHLTVSSILINTIMDCCPVHYHKHTCMYTVCMYVYILNVVYSPEMVTEFAM